MKKILPKAVIRTLLIFLALTYSCIWCYAGDSSQVEELKVTETSDAIEIILPPNSAKAPNSTKAKNQFDPLEYTLGPEDIVEIMVLRHPEFSGVYPINQEGKIQYKFVGDMDVKGLTKQQLEQKIREALSAYVISPEVNVTITEYKSKVFYVLGEVGTPGKYYMRSEAIPVREAAFMAGLPTQAAAMRKCQIITPDENGNAKIKKIDLYSILYGGNLKNNIAMRPGDVLYVPSTVMAKIIRVINPVASTMGVASAGPSSASTAKTSFDTLAK
ncbi:MAG: polysaccharide export protein [Candidatus Omnitrophica bacterium]|nr:polysaccharide export protein [Candidatus Omnitrophota bacterium]